MTFLRLIGVYHILIKILQIFIYANQTIEDSYDKDYFG